MKECLVHRVSMRHPGDVSEVMRLVETGAVPAAGIVAILGKTEGNGCVNDFTRAFAVTALKSALAGPLGLSPDSVGERIAMVMSGGTEGGLAPHFVVFAERESAAPPQGKALSVGVALTRAFRPEEIGRMAQVEVTAAAVKEAIARAGIADIADVHWVQVKCPLLTLERIAEAKRRGATVASEDTYASMGIARGASALGIALALGEVAPAQLADTVICRDWALWSATASTSAGVELLNSEVIVFGNSAAWTGELTIGHRVMKDALDLPSVLGLMRDLDLPVADGQLSSTAAARVTAVLVKAEASRSGVIRGTRHVMWDDSDFQASRHIRGFVGGLVAGVTGGTELFVSGGAEHQGPDGGGPIAVIARREADRLASGLHLR
jgi:cyanuric acid amidohydrolase